MIAVMPLMGQLLSCAAGFAGGSIHAEHTAAMNDGRSGLRQKRPFFTVSWLWLQGCLFVGRLCQKQKVIPNNGRELPVPGSFTT